MNLVILWFSGIIFSLKAVQFLGPIWKRHRQMLVPAFSLPVLHGFIGVFNSQARILVKNLSAKVDAGRFNILPFLSEITLQTICMTTFGVDPVDDGDFVKKYMQSVDKLLGLIGMKFYKFWLHSDFIRRFLGWNQEEEDIIKILNNMSDVIIQKKRTALKNKQSVIDNSTNLKYKSLMDLLLDYSEKNALSNKEIREEVDTFIVAGYDTTSLGVSYTLMNLGTYPEIQDRVYKEIQKVFEDTDRDVQKEDITQLVYTEAVIKETLRIYAPVPVLMRHADKDIQLKNYKIRAGSEVGILSIGLNRHPVWGADVHEFRPERWLNLTPQQKNAYTSFSLGKRSCVGQHSALMSMKTTLTHILRNYRVTANNRELRFKVDFILKPAGGCNLILERRN